MKKVKIWYIITCCIVFADTIISFLLPSNIYFNIWVSILVRLIIIINIIIIPSALLIRSSVNKEKNVMLNIANTIAILSITLIITIVFMLTWGRIDKVIPDIDLNMQNITISNNQIVVEYPVWLETQKYIAIYDVKSLFLVRQIANYKDMSN